MCALVAAAAWHGAATLMAGDLAVVNGTGQNLPELELQVELALGELVERVPGRMVLTVDLCEATNLRERNVQPFPSGPRYAFPRGYVNDWATVMVQGRIAVWRPGAAAPEERRFLGRCAAWQDHEPHFATARARRPFAGFQAYPGRLDPNGPLVIGALSNAFEAGKLDRWLLGAR